MKKKVVILLIVFIGFMILVFGGMKIYEGTRLYKFDDNGNIQYYDGMGFDSYIYVTPGALFDYSVIEQDEEKKADKMGGKVVFTDNAWYFESSDGEKNIITDRTSVSNPILLIGNNSKAMVVFGSGEKSLIYFTDNGGILWKEVSHPAAGDTVHFSVTGASAVDGGKYFIGYRYFGEYLGLDLYCTEDNGNNWERIPLEKQLPQDLPALSYTEVKSIEENEDTIKVTVSCVTEARNPWAYEVVFEYTSAGDTWTVKTVSETAETK